MPDPGPIASEKDSGRKIYIYNFSFRNAACPVTLPVVGVYAF